MHLTPKEEDRLTLFTLAELARRRRARGRKLNAPEAIALICDEMLERAWDGASMAEVVASGRSVLTRDDVMEGVPELVRHVEVDALFPAGTSLVAVDDPIGPPAMPGAWAPGAVAVAADGPIVINPGRPTLEVEVENTGGATVQVSSHYHFYEVNPALAFDRAATLGMRLDVPAGSAVGWAPGQRRRVTLVPLAGDRVAYGFAGAVNGPVAGHLNGAVHSADADHGRG